ncbi:MULTISPECIES: DUF397 domain-containing protein [unclassified Streptomyces]|uniref:DUF397 domain-containing protein n=1 Tax=unclassified Streptomyces TaxID=2593676 RepID=UPI00278C033E|nr:MULTISPECIES: DUF397 domain-containing protein [unclassified Streptomyces]
MSSTDSTLEWFKSSFSSNEPDSDCVEIATSPGTVHIRDSKQPTRAQLALPTRAWAPFVDYAATRRT